MIWRSQLLFAPDFIGRPLMAEVTPGASLISAICYAPEQGVTQWIFQQ